MVDTTKFFFKCLIKLLGYLWDNSNNSSSNSNNKKNKNKNKTKTKQQKTLP